MWYLVQPFTFLHFVNLIKQLIRLKLTVQLVQVATEAYMSIDSSKSQNIVECNTTI